MDEDAAKYGSSCGSGSQAATIGAICIILFSVKFSEKTLNARLGNEVKDQVSLKIKSWRQLIPKNLALGVERS